MSNSNPILTDKAAKPLGLYPHSRKLGNLLFLSGIGPRKAGTDEIPGLKLDKYGNYLEFDFAAQVRSVFDNVKTVLEESGSSWDKLVDVTVFLVNMKRDFHLHNLRMVYPFASSTCGHDLGNPKVRSTFQILLSAQPVTDPL